MADADDKADENTKGLEVSTESLEVLKERLRVSTSIREQQELSYEIQVKELEAQGAKGVEQLKQLKNQQAMAKTWDDIFGAMTGVSDKWEQSTWYKMSQPKAMEGMVLSFQRTFTAANIAYSSISKVAEASIALAYEQDEAAAAFNRDTGAMRMYGDQMLQLERGMFHHGVGLKEAASAYTALQAEMGQLNNMSKTQQTELAQTTALLEAFGVSAGTTAQNMNFLTAAMGMTASEAATTQREMFVLAQEIGMAPEKMASGFAAARPQMAKFGAEGTEVFKKLAVNAKNASMEVDQLLNITERFDTFEGAAESVGRLNAILGGPFLNSMEMVSTTDPTERMKLLSNAVNEAGASFDDMSYYERIALTEAMGLKDVSELALVMRDGFDETVPAIAKSQSELSALADQSREYNSLKDEMVQLMKAFAVSMTPVIKGLKWLLQGIQDVNAFTGGKLIPGIMFAITIFFGIPAILGGIGTAFVAVGSLIGTAATGIMSAGVAAAAGVTAMAGSLPAAGLAAGSATPGFLGLGFAILMMGAGIGLAAAGLALFVGAFSLLEPAQLLAAGVALIALGWGLYFLIPAMGGFAAMMAVGGWMAIAAMVALGIAALALGAGIGLAAAGLGAFVASFALLFGVAGPAALAALGTAFESFSASIAGIDTTNLVPLTQFFNSLSSVLDKDIAKMLEMKTALEAIVSAVNAVDDTEKLVAVRQIIEAVNSSAAGSKSSHVAALNPAGAAGAAGATGANALSRPLEVKLVMNGREMGGWAYKTVSDFLNYYGN